MSNKIIFQFDDNLEYQKNAVKSVVELFRGLPKTIDSIYAEKIRKTRITEKDPVRNIDIVKGEKLLQNLKKVQLGNGLFTDEISYRNHERDFTIEMETGTGKTYVYLRTILELYKEYGFKKFMIVVPSIAIRKGVEKSIKQLTEHFKRLYNVDLSKYSFIYDSSNLGKMSSNFVESNDLSICVLNIQAFNKDTNKIRKDDEYDKNLWRDIKFVRPIVLIDEPQKIEGTTKKKSQSLKAIDELEPLFTLRYSATHKNLYNQVYKLDSYEAYKKDLVKKIQVKTINGVISKDYPYIRYTHFTKDLKARIEMFSQIQGESIRFKSFDVENGVSLYELSGGLSQYKDMFIAEQPNKVKPLKVSSSNEDIELELGESNKKLENKEIIRIQIRLAIKNHFEKQFEILDEGRKIKGLTLFFIDEVKKVRDNDTKDRRGDYLKIFDEEYEMAIKKYKEKIEKYKNYFPNYENVNLVREGYFALDKKKNEVEVDDWNSDKGESAVKAKSQEDIDRGIELILEKKDELISFNEPLAFIFSHSALREGWDNPNVFTIAKLRSSGSDNSKLQEVGRGLRLPVDENGNRISNEEFKLNYIVDFTEADFAEKLIDEINGELPESHKITDELLKNVAKKRGIDFNALFFELGAKGYINMNREIIIDKKEEFFTSYPEFATGLYSNKITDINKNKKEVVQIRKAVFSELKELWERINHKYYLFYDVDLTDEISQALHDILRRTETFGNVTLYSHREQIATNENTMIIRKASGVSYSVKRSIPYNEFLKRINEQTSIPIRELHNAMCELSKEKKITDEYINEYSLANIVSEFIDWRIEKLQTRFKYKPSSQPVTETALTNKDGSIREVINRGIVGTKFVEGTPSDKYLYDKIVFDSPLEKENIMTDIEEVVVYGKIPKASVAIPTIVGESYSPDFMYIVKHKNGTKELNIVVETKSVEKKSTLRGIEDAKIKCAEAFFKQLTIDGYTVTFHTQLSNKNVKQIIEEVLKE